MKKLNDYANALANLTHFVSQRFINEIVTKPETENNEPYRFFYTLLIKTNSALDTCSLLLCNYYRRPHHIDSLAIIMRSIITDCVVYLYLLDKSKSNDQELLKNISAIYFDHVEFTVKGLKNHFKDIYDWPDHKVSEEIATIKSARPNYYHPDGKPIFDSFPSSVRYILGEMAKNRKPGEKDDLQNLYHHYDILSKYEHPGEFSFQLIHQQYSVKTRDQFLDQIVHAINRSIIPTYISLVGVWPDLAKSGMPDFNVHFETLLATYQPSNIN